MSGLLARLGGLFLAPAAAATPPPRVMEEAEEWLTPLVEGEAEAPPRPLVAWEPPVGIEWPPRPAARTPAEDGAASDRSRLVAGHRPAVGAAVLGSGDDAVALGAALAGELRARGRLRTALVLVWDPLREAPEPMPAWPGASNLAATLAADHVAAARGCIVQVQLPHDPEAAAVEGVRLSREASVPTVMVAAGPRTAFLEELLSTRDVLVVLESAVLSGHLAELAAAELRHLNARVLVEEPIGGAARRLLARAGLSRARRLGTRIEALLP